VVTIRKVLKKGLLIAFEGIDGAGKTKQAQVLKGHLSNLGYDIVLTKEPTDGLYGRRIKQLSHNRELSPAKEYELFVADRKEHIKSVIGPSLKEKKIVVVDRYYFSTMAYQGALGLDVEAIKKENESFAPVPDVVFLLMVSPKVGLSRIRKRRNEIPNLFEDEQYLSKVEEIFHSLDESYVVKLDGHEAFESLSKTITNAVDDIIRRYSNPCENPHTPGR
jgi:dTMP kinase